MQHPVQGVSVKAAASREYIHGYGLGTERVGHPELAHDLQTSGGHCPGSQRPDQFVRLLLGHARSSASGNQCDPSLLDYSTAEEIDVKSAMKTGLASRPRRGR